MPITTFISGTDLAGAPGSQGFLYTNVTSDFLNLDHTPDLTIKIPKP
jgi:hypothetical protein